VSKIQSYSLRAATVIVLRERGRTQREIGEIVGMTEKGVQRLLAAWRRFDLNADARRRASREIDRLLESDQTQPL
jgi:transposase